MISSSSLSSPPSIPAGSVAEQDEPDIKLESSHCGGEDRAETEVHIAATTSDGTSAVCDPMGQSGEVEGVIAPDPEQTGDPKSDPPPTEEEKEELLGNPDQQEPDGSTAGIVDENPLEHIKDREDGSAEDRRPAITLYSSPTQNEEAENGDAMEAAVLLENSETRTSKNKEELTGGDGDGAEASAGDGAGAGASPTDPRSGGLSTVELCEAAALPGGSLMKDSVSDGTNLQSENVAGSSSNAEPLQTSDTTDPFGSGYLDYVTDSQLNTIVLSEVEVMEEDVGPPDHEDATDLICGLIRELSSLNRKVMATHRDLENLRRGNKPSRSSTR
ncbi:break repair meiotic recombinase recruitment factor 1-like isoform X1 [Eleginops maclovinus]|uniref:break repair meiotic recombinase recruitment factor 1-like isoform X1 n=2 Tax=Eleginops maclovinus TaxID=56733 RepID=UPI003080FBC5